MFCSVDKSHDQNQSSSQQSLDNQVNRNRNVAIDLNNTGSDLFNLEDDPAAFEMYQEAVTSLMMSLKPEDRVFPVVDDSEHAQTCRVQKVEAGKRRMSELLSSQSSAQDKAYLSRRRRYSKGRLDLFQRIESACDPGPQLIMNSLLIPPESVQSRDTNIDLAIIMYNMALVKFFDSNPPYSDLIRLFKISFSMTSNLEEKCSQSTLVSVAALNNLGTLHYKSEMYDKALSCFVESLHLCRIALHYPRVEFQASECEPLLNEYIGTITSNIARIYYTSGQYDEAVEMCQESLNARRIVSVQKSKDGNCDITAEEDLVASLYNLGVIHHHLGELDDSMKYYQDFVMRVKLLSKRCKSHNLIEQDCLYSRDLVTVLCNIVLIDSQVDIIKKSTGTQDIEMNIKQVQLTRAEFGYDHENLPFVLRQVGSYFLEQADYHNALTFFCEELRVEKSQGSPRIENIISTLNLIGQSHQQNNELEQAMKYYFQAVNLLSVQEHNRCPQQDYIFSVVLYNIGMIHFRAGSNDKAVQAFEKAIALCQSGTVDNSGLSAMLHNIGIAQLDMGKVSSALESFNMSFDLRVSFYGERSSQVAESLYQIAHIHNKTGKTCLALELYCKTAEIERETLGHFHPDVAVTLCSIGQIYHSEGALEKALDIYMEAYGVSRRALDTDNTSPLSISSILNIIGDIYLELGERYKAIEAFAEAVSTEGDSKNEHNSRGAPDVSNVFRNKLARPDTAAAA